MKIHSMTATFGKLEHQTLTLQPGLNVIEAPNEWGKSTWCAFLVNMLYGMDTRARTTAAALADKERYAPWSGAPMAGRIELSWNDRNITIERSSAGRVIFGNFKAYETETGIEVPELTAANCGQMLLGVERSVFTRAGFLKLSDLPVTQDDSLRRRLNNLVTTGDESGAGDKLGQQLKDLKNKCRFNRSGLLPQAENEREQLRSQLDDLQTLNTQVMQLRTVQSQLETHIDKLENHAQALRFAASLADAQKVEAAEEAVRQTEQRLQATIDACQSLPALTDAQKNLQSAQNLQEHWLSLQMESQMLPPMPEKPEIPEHLRDVDAAYADTEKNAKLERSRKKTGILVGIYVILAIAALVVGYLMPTLLLYMGAAVVLGGVVVIGACIITTNVIRKDLQKLYDRHPGIAPQDWVAKAQEAADQWHSYEVLLQNAGELRADLDERIAELKSRMDQLTDGASMADCQSTWAKTVAAWDAVSDARRDLQQARHHAQTLKAMLKPVQPPKEPDTLTYTAPETEQLLSDARLKLRQLHTRLGQCQGQIESIGSEALIRARLDTLSRRIARLEDTYYALEMAQDALREASNQLQRRFAPRISKRAQTLFGKLTDGRYDRLTLGQDLSLSTSAQNEDTLRSSQWRSDGTTDQLYLALRLAVAEELTPDAPLILDDAFVRFDDTRLEKAMAILKEEAESKQVIVFTCQAREKKYL